MVAGDHVRLLSTTFDVYQDLIGCEGFIEFALSNGLYEVFIDGYSIVASENELEVIKCIG